MQLLQSWKHVCPGGPKVARFLATLGCLMKSLRRDNRSVGSAIVGEDFACGSAALCLCGAHCLDTAARDLVVLRLCGEKESLRDPTPAKQARADSDEREQTGRRFRNNQFTHPHIVDQPEQKIRRRRIGRTRSVDVEMGK